MAGFGKIRWVEGNAIRLEGDLATLATAEPAILGHMNADHAEAIEHMVGRGPGWRMTGIDPEGADFRREGEIARVEFAGEVRDAGRRGRSWCGWPDRARTHANTSFPRKRE